MKKKIGTGILVLMALLYLAPVFFTLIKSLGYEESRLTLRQYLEFLTTNYTAMHYFWNSALYATVITVLCLVISFPLGFLFAKVRFKGRDTLFFIYVLVMLLPFQATLLPNYIGLREMGLLETRAALILPMLFSPFAVFLLRQFMVGIPQEQLEYTMLETGSVLRMLIHVVLPQTKDALLALAILIFCENWNMVEQVVIFLPEQAELWPLSVMLTKLPEDVVYAGAVIYMYPVLILFLCFRNTLSKSMEKFRW